MYNQNGDIISLEEIEDVKDIEEFRRAETFRMDDMSADMSELCKDIFKDPEQGRLFITDYLAKGELNTMKELGASDLKRVVKHFGYEGASSSMMSQDLENARDVVQKVVESSVAKNYPEMEKGSPAHKAAVMNYILNEPDLREDLVPDLRGEQKGLLLREGERLKALDAISELDEDMFASYAYTAESQQKAQKALEAAQDREENEAELGMVR